MQNKWMTGIIVVLVVLGLTVGAGAKETNDKVNFSEKTKDRQQQEMPQEQPTEITNETLLLFITQLKDAAVQKDIEKIFQLIQENPTVATKALTFLEKMGESDRETAYIAKKLAGILSHAIAKELISQLMDAALQKDAEKIIQLIQKNPSAAATALTLLEQMGEGEGEVADTAKSLAEIIHPVLNFEVQRQIDKDKIPAGKAIEHPHKQGKQQC